MEDRSNRTIQHREMRECVRALMGFESTIPFFEPPKNIFTFDFAATGTGRIFTGNSKFLNLTVRPNVL
jgi:hypothetical protein